MSTIVLTVPSARLSVRRGLVEGLVIKVPVDRVAEEEPREEQHLGPEEEPHAQANGMVLLLDRLVVLGQVRVAGVRVR